MLAIQRFSSWKETQRYIFCPSPPCIPCWRNPQDCRCWQAERKPRPPPAITYPHHFMPVNSAMQQWVFCTWVSVCLSLDACASERVQAAGSFNKANSAVDCRAGWLTISVVLGSMEKHSASPLLHPALNLIKALTSIRWLKHSSLTRGAFCLLTVERLQELLTMITY